MFHCFSVIPAQFVVQITKTDSYCGDYLSQDNLSVSNPTVVFSFVLLIIRSSSASSLDSPFINNFWVCLWGSWPRSGIVVFWSMFFSKQSQFRSKEGVFRSQPTQHKSFTLGFCHRSLEVFDPLVNQISSSDCEAVQFCSKTLYL